MAKTSKKCSQSRVDQCHLIMPEDLNNFDILYGARLMELVDNTCGQSYMKHTRVPGVTASVDRIDFLKAFNKNHSVCLTSYVSGVSGNRVEVFFKAVGEDLVTGEKYIGACGYLTFACLDKEPELPGVEPETPEEIAVCSGFQARYEKTNQNRQSSKDLAELLDK